MNVTDLSRMMLSEINSFFGTYNKPQSAEVFASGYNPVNTPAPAPNWNQIPTKSKPKMSDEKFEEAIRALAKEEASKGILASTDAQRALRHEYVSVVSPDRKAMYNNGTFQINGSLRDQSMHYNKSANMWFYKGTTAETARKSRFTEIYTQAYQEYEAEHGAVKGTPKVEHFNAFG